MHGKEAMDLKVNKDGYMGGSWWNEREMGK